MLDTIIIAAMAFYLGWRIKEALMLLTFREILKDLGVAEDRIRKLAADQGIEISQPQNSRVPDQGIEIRVEQHGNQLYAYRVDTNEFLGQGGDRDALVERISMDFKNQRFTIRPDQGADLLKT